MMNKIKNAKREIKVLAYGTVMLTVGFYFGKKYEEVAVSTGLGKLAKSGKKLYTVIDNEVYVMSVIKDQINKD